MSRKQVHVILVNGSRGEVLASRICFGADDRFMNAAADVFTENSLRPKGKIVIAVGELDILIPGSEDYPTVVRIQQGTSGENPVGMTHPDFVWKDSSEFRSGLQKIMKQADRTPSPGTGHDQVSQPRA
ncbi:MAG: hypothetical protein M3O22_04245 [Pseudomonadota bacterium]|nr:hypothetical protein [Pseudomonadota bacterium]